MNIFVIGHQRIILTGVLPIRTYISTNHQSQKGDASELAAMSYVPYWLSYCHSPSLYSNLYIVGEAVAI